MTGYLSRVRQQVRQTGEDAVGLGELVRALMQPAAAEPIAGLSGMYHAATGGVDEGVRAIEAMRRKAAYEPQTAQG